METTNFRKYAVVYGLFNQGRDYVAEGNYIAGLIREYGAPGKSVLDLGCGTGEHAVDLGRRGFAVRGIERSPDMAAIAREKGVQCEVGDIALTRLDGRLIPLCRFFM